MWDFALPSGMVIPYNPQVTLSEEVTATRSEDHGDRSTPTSPPTHTHISWVYHDLADCWLLADSLCGGTVVGFCRAGQSDHGPPPLASWNFTVSLTFSISAFQSVHIEGDCRVRTRFTFPSTSSYSTLLRLKIFTMQLTYVTSLILLVLSSPNRQWNANHLPVF